MRTQTRTHAHAHTLFGSVPSLSSNCCQQFRLAAAFWRFLGSEGNDSNDFFASFSFVASQSGVFIVSHKDTHTVTEPNNWQWSFFTTLVLGLCACVSIVNIKYLCGIIKLYCAARSLSLSVPLARTINLGGHIDMNMHVGKLLVSDGGTVLGGGDDRNNPFPVPLYPVSLLV